MPKQFKRDNCVDRAVLLSALRTLAVEGVVRARAATLARESAGGGHHVPKKFVRRRLSAAGEAVTGIEGVTISEEPHGRFWFALTEAPERRAIPDTCRPSTVSRDDMEAST